MMERLLYGKPPLLCFPFAREDYRPGALPFAIFEGWDCTTPNPMGFDFDYWGARPTSNLPSISKESPPSSRFLQARLAMQRLMFVMPG